MIFIFPSRIYFQAMHHVNGFNAWKDLPSVSNKQAAADASMPFDCFVMLRHPIERAISLFYGEVQAAAAAIITAVTHQQHTHA